MNQLTDQCAYFRHILHQMIIIDDKKRIRGQIGGQGVEQRGQDCRQRPPAVFFQHPKGVLAVGIITMMESRDQIDQKEQRVAVRFGNHVPE